MDYEALAQVQAEEAAEEEEQARIRKLWEENQKIVRAWEAMALVEDMSEDTNESRMHQVTVDLPVEEVPVHAPSVDSQIPNLPEQAETQESNVTRRDETKRPASDVKKRGRSERIAKRKKVASNAFSVFE